MSGRNDAAVPDVSLPPGYFADVYRANADPWGFETSAYEAEKYAATLAALPNPRYANAFEIGCSIGVLTAQLGRRCDRLLAVDIVPEVLARAAERCQDQPQIRFAEMRVPDTFPDERFDLIVLSEVGYYWSTDDLARARRRIVDALPPGGHLVLVHWTPFVHDYPLTGDQVHEAFLSAVPGAPGEPSRGLVHLGGFRRGRYRLDLLARPE